MCSNSFIGRIGYIWRFTAIEISCFENDLKRAFDVNNHSKEKKLLLEGNDTKKCQWKAFSRPLTKE